MKSKFSIASLLVNLQVFVSATLTYGTSAWGFPESHPLVAVISFVVFITFLSEIPLIYFSRHLGFPVVLPTVSIILAIMGFRKRENRKLSIVSMALLLVSVLIYLSLRLLTH